MWIGPKHNKIIPRSEINSLIDIKTLTKLNNKNFK